MARPQKQIVDYFPHATRHGETLFVLENRFGNDGYAFWFKLLEFLGQKEGHFVDCNNPAAWEFLLAKTRVNEVTANEILNTLSTLNTIDSELWEKRVIWCQNFVDGVRDAYKRRSCAIPTKEGLCEQLRGLCIQKPIKSGVSVNINPQSKVNKSKVNKSKEKKYVAIPLPDFINPSKWQDYLAMREEKKKPATERAQKLIIEKLSKWNSEGHDTDAILDASIINSWTDVYLPQGKGTSKLSKKGESNGHTGLEGKNYREGLEDFK